MAHERTYSMNDYIDDYENASQDYANMGPLWAEMVFPDDFEALQAIYGGREKSKEAPATRNEERNNVRSTRR